MGYIFVTRDRCGGCSIQRKNPCIHGLYFCNPQRRWSLPCADICPFVLVGFACELMVRLIEKYASAFLGYIFVTQKGCGYQSYRASSVSLGYIFVTCKGCGRSLVRIYAPLCWLDSHVN